jgi:hypothetical protein
MKLRTIKIKQSREWEKEQIDKDKARNKDVITFGKDQDRKEIKDGH